MPTRLSGWCGTQERMWYHIMILCHIKCCTTTLCDAWQLVRQPKMLTYDTMHYGSSRSYTIICVILVYMILPITTSLIGLNSKISPTKVDGEWWNNCCSLQNHSINELIFLKNCVYECISCNACMHKVHALVNFLLILACNDLLHLEIWTCDGKQSN